DVLHGADEDDVLLAEVPDGRGVLRERAVAGVEARARQLLLPPVAEAPRELGPHLVRYLDVVRVALAEVPLEADREAAALPRDPHLQRVLVVGHAVEDDGDLAEGEGLARGPDAHLALV